MVARRRTANAPYIHPQALVETRTIGPRTRVWAFAHVQDGVWIGADCNIGDHCYIESGVAIGDGVIVKNGVSIWTGVTIESGAFIGPNVAFTNDLRPRSRVRRDLCRTVIREGASIGANATLLSEIEIGHHALVGAGAVVTRSVPPFAVVTGSPARVRGAVCRCGEALRFVRSRAACGCGARYRRVDGRVGEL